MQEPIYGLRVSAILPCLNEEKFIGQCLDSLLNQDMPKTEYEILCVLGPSSDKTEEILSRYSLENTNMRVLRNPHKNTAISFNIGIKAARGETIFTLGAHTTYSSNYFSVAWRYLKRYDCVGSTAKTMPREDTFIAQAICQVLSSPFGVGNSKMRTGLSAPMETDTASCPGYRRDVFEKVGLFNEKLKHTQDMEFNRRLKRTGGRILTTPEILSYYKARSSLGSFWKANYVNGFWSIYPIKYSAGMPVSIRHLVPLFFVGALLVSAMLSFALKSFGLIFLSIIASYFLAAFWFSYGIAKRTREWMFVVVLPPLFLSLHFLYGLGSWAAVWRVLPREVPKV